MFRFASCEPECPVLLAGTGSLRQHSPCAASRSRRSLAATQGALGLFPSRLRCSAPQKGAGLSANPSIPGLRRLSLPALASAAGNAAQMGPLWGGEGAQEKSAGGRARCAPVRCVHKGEAGRCEMPVASRAAERRSQGWRRPGFARGAGSVAGKVHSANPVAASRSRRAGCPETAPPGWPSLWLLSLGHARESDSLARSASESSAPASYSLAEGQ